VPEESWITVHLGSVTVTLKVWLRADDYDFDLLARMFAVGDTRFVREGARRYLTNRELDELAESGEVPHKDAAFANQLLRRRARQHVLPDRT
jgi:hypothetical protein